MSEPSNKSNKAYKIVIAILIIIIGAGGYFGGTYLYDEGYSDGHNDGYDSGYDSGYSEGKLDAYWDFQGEYEGLEEYSWMMDNVVFTTRTGDCYHKITCQYAQDRTIYVSFINAAESDGYRPCSFCFGGY